MNNGNNNGNNTFDQDSVFDFESFTQGANELIKFGKGMGLFVDSTVKFGRDAGSVLELLTNNQRDIATNLRDTQVSALATTTSMIELIKFVDSVATRVQSLSDRCKRLEQRCKRLEKANCSNC